MEAKVRDVGWPKGEVFALGDHLEARDAVDRAVIESNPQLYLHPDFDPDADPILVVGMPGWGGRSENFIWTLINGLEHDGLTRRLVVASIQDTKSGGPRYQGQGDRAHANVWHMNTRSVRVMTRFLETVSGKVGPLQVYFIGYSTGGVSAPLASTRVAALAEGTGARFTVQGAVALGTGSRVKASALRSTGQRVLFVVVPRKRAQDPKPLRDDQWNRHSAEIAQERLAAEGATTYLRHIQSARRHVDWHWGLISQCRYFKGTRIDPGRGYWPNYWKPNPETQVMIATFIQGQVPPETASFPDTPCPY
jgi:hypothetical protein